jgi:hypothetical protein
MTIHPPLSLQNAGPVENAVDWRNLFAAVANALGGPGVVGSSALTAVATADPSTPTVAIAAGPCFVPNSSDNSMYFCYSDAPFTVDLATPDASHHRIDTIVFHVQDNEGGDNDGQILAIEGTPDSSPIAPTDIPDNSLPLWDCNVTPTTGAVALTKRYNNLPANFHINQDLAVDGNGTVSGDLEVDGDLTVDGDSTLGGLIVTGTKIMHTGFTASTDYALDQDSGGDTYLNAQAGAAIHLREGNSSPDLVTIQDTGGVTEIDVANGMPAGAGTYPVKYSTGTGKLTIDTSSRRTKRDEVALLDEVDALAVVQAIAPKTFEMLDDDSRRWAGFVAEDVAEVFPMGATYSTVDGEQIAESLADRGLLAVLWGAVQQLADRVEYRGK